MEKFVKEKMRLQKKPITKNIPDTTLIFVVVRGNSK